MCCMCRAWCSAAASPLLGISYLLALPPSFASSCLPHSLFLWLGPCAAHHTYLSLPPPLPNSLCPMYLSVFLPASSSLLFAFSASQVTGSMRVIPLEDATAATCGAKGASCGELLRLAKQCDEVLSQRGGNGDSAGALFQAPDGVCLPYGCMELALQARGVYWQYWATALLNASLACSWRAHGVQH